MARWVVGPGRRLYFDGLYQFTVSSSGEGMRPSDLDRIAERIAALFNGQQRRPFVHNTKYPYRVGDHVADWLAEHGAEAVVIREVDHAQGRYFVETISGTFEGECRWIPFDNCDPRHDTGQEIG